MMRRKKLLKKLNEEEKRLIAYWNDAKPFIAKDLANVWIEEVKVDFEKISGEAERVLYIFQKMHEYYKTDEEKFSEEVKHTKNLMAHLKGVRPDSDSVRQIHNDIQLVVIDIEKEKGSSRRSFLKTIAAGFLARIHNLPEAAEGVTRPREPVLTRPTSDFSILMQLSPYNVKRPLRPETKYIILHTTEANDASSLTTIQAKGLANFVVDTSGRIYNTIEMGKIAKHAGRSMWNGKGNLSNISVGIEVVGYHDQLINDRQFGSLRWLIEKMKERFRLKDNDVLAHSMVAYGSPNRFFDRNHRGRKRCGMLFALPEVRLRLGLRSKPVRDPDVQAGRLIAADKYLEDVLYGKPTPIKPGEVVRAPTPITPQMPDSVTAAEIEGFVEIGPEKPTAYSIAGREFKSKSTIYFLPPPYKLVRMGDEMNGELTADGNKLIDRLPQGTKVLIGYIYGGKIIPGKSLFQIVGKRWNYPSTYYRLPDGEIKSGDDIEPARIPKGTIILFRS